jgi:hypothetical protein
VCTFAKINGPRRQQDASASWNADHGRNADARTARSTTVNWAASYMPDETRTAAPASLTSGAADAARRTGAAGMASLTGKSDYARAATGHGPGHRTIP